MPEIYKIDDNGNGAWPYIASMNNNGNGGFGRGFLGSLVGGFLGSLFPNLFNGGGIGGIGGGGAAAAALGAQANGNNNTDLVIQAVTAQGEQARQATQTLSTMLGQDFNMVNTAIGSIASILNGMAVTNATTPLQIINAIQSGNAEMARQFSQCCCDQKLLTSEQTNQLMRGMDGINQNILATKAAQELADCKQTYTLTETMNRNYQLLDNKIDMLESQRKDREIAAKDAEIASLKSQNFTVGALGQAMAPVNAMLSKLAAEVDAIKCKLPNTINVEYPQVAVVNTTPYMNAGAFGYNNFNF